MKIVATKLVSAFAGMVLSVLALRYTHSGVFFFTFIVSLTLFIVYWLDLGTALRALTKPNLPLRVIGILMGVPQALLGLTCFVTGTGIVAWVLYNVFIEKQPEFPALVLGFGIGPSLVTFGLGWMLYAFRRSPPPPPVDGKA